MELLKAIKSVFSRTNNSGDEFNKRMKELIESEFELQSYADFFDTDESGEFTYTFKFQDVKEVDYKVVATFVPEKQGYTVEFVRDGDSVISFDGADTETVFDELSSEFEKYRY